MNYTVTLVDLGIANIGPNFDARQTWVVYAGPEGAPEEQQEEVGVVEPRAVDPMDRLYGRMRPYLLRLYVGPQLQEFVSMGPGYSEFETNETIFHVRDEDHARQVATAYLNGRPT